ncbi:hypothetical protein RJT34_03007 [Clitoria ternatea]|uniref:Uncharacterized protein n=1 Tax=Clitoria ternatea TaxID=43366 RepID=A0AAN9KLB1_CLITE
MSINRIHRNGAVSPKANGVEPCRFEPVQRSRRRKRFTAQSQRVKSKAANERFHSDRTQGTLQPLFCRC